MLQGSQTIRSYSVLDVLLPTIIIIMQECSHALKMFVELILWKCSKMLLVLSITFVTTVYGIVCVQLAHFSLGDWKDISIAHVIIIIKSEPYPLLSYFSVVVCLRCLLHHILSLIAYTFLGNRDYCAVYEYCKYSDTFWLADRVRLFVHYTISLSSFCKLI